MTMDMEKAGLFNWISKGTKNEVLLKKIAAVGLMMLFIYKAGYVVGIALCNMGF